MVKNVDIYKSLTISRVKPSIQANLLYFWAIKIYELVLNSHMMHYITTI